MTPQPWEVDRAKERAELGRATIDDALTLFAALQDAEGECEGLESAHADEIAEIVGEKDTVTQYVEGLQHRLIEMGNRIARLSEDIPAIEDLVQTLHSMAEEDPMTYVAPKRDAAQCKLPKRRRR